jgi:hypothetical protein
MIQIRKSDSDSEGRRKMIEEIREKIMGGAEFQDLARNVFGRQHSGAGRGLGLDQPAHVE